MSILHDFESAMMEKLCRLVFLLTSTAFLLTLFGQDLVQEVGRDSLRTRPLHHHCTISSFYDHP